MSQERAVRRSLDPKLLRDMTGEQLADLISVLDVRPRAVLVGRTAVYGISFKSVNSNALGFAATAPLAGRHELLRLWTTTGDVSLALGLHTFQLAFGDSVPTSQAELSKLEGLFPFANDPVTNVPRLQIAANEQTFMIEGPFRIEPRGRRIVCGWVNAGTAASAAYVGMVLQRVD